MTQLLIALFLVTFSIFIHELGHFLVARWRGLVVPRFSLFGIGKPIVSWKWRGVEYCISWLPIGAFVMIPQLSDLGEFEGERPADLPPLPPAGYLSKVMVAFAGPAANISFAMLLACVVWVVGIEVPVEFNRTEVGEVIREVKTTDGKTVPGPAAAAGLQTGDTILRIDDKPVANFEDVYMGIILGSQVAKDGRRLVQVTYERNGAIETRAVYPELVGREGLRAIGIAPRSDLLVDKISPDSPAAKAGLRAGDRIVAVDSRPLSRRDELRQHFQKKNSEPSVLDIKRGSETITTNLQPRQETIEGQQVYLIGVTWKIETVLVHRTPLAQLADSCRRIYSTFSSLLNYRSDVGVRHMSGIVGIVDNLQQAATIGVIPMLAFLMAINLSLAIFNLLPIPVLDGGHIMLATLSKLRGRPVDPEWTKNAFAACFFMLIGLIVYVTYHDIRRSIQDRFDDNPSSAAPAKAPASDTKAPAPAPTPAK